jgi:hypothetical protein
MTTNECIAWFSCYCLVTGGYFLIVVAIFGKCKAVLVSSTILLVLLFPPSRYVDRKTLFNFHISPEMQTRYKIVAGSVCGFPKFVTSGSGLGSGFSKIQFWVWVRVQSSKIFQKTGFWVQVWVGFCKKHQNTSEIPVEKLFFLYIEEI